MARWNAPVVLCAPAPRSGPSITVFCRWKPCAPRNIAIAGIAFIGDENRESEHIIADLGRVRHLGRLPHLDPLTGPSLHAAFARHFRIEDFLKEPA